MISAKFHEQMEQNGRASSTIPGFSCHSSLSTHICNPISFCTLSCLACLAHQPGAYLLKRAKASQDTPSRPGRVLAFGGREDFDAHILNRQPLYLVQQSIPETFSQSGSTRQHNAPEKAFSKIHVGPMDCIDEYLMHAGIFKTNQFGVEQYLWCSKPFGANLSSKIS